jgi:hypothetical protein
MSIQYHGQTYWLHVQAGEGGVEAFKADVKRLLGLSPQDDFDITFECQVPGEGACLEGGKGRGGGGGHVGDEGGRGLLGLSPQDDFDITFECQVSGEGAVGGGGGREAGGEYGREGLCRSMGEEG